MRNGGGRRGLTLAAVAIIGAGLMQLMGCGPGAGARFQAPEDQGFTGAGQAAPSGFRGLPALPASAPGPRTPSYSNVIYYNGNAIYDSSAGCLFAGNSVVLPAGPGALEYAMYAFNTSGYAPAQLEVGLATGNGSTAWVGVSNYVANTWQFYGPFTSAASIDFNGFGYLSGGGQFYALVVAYNSSTVTDNYLVLTYDNAVSADFSIAGTVRDEHGAPIGGAHVSLDPEFTEVVTNAQGEYFVPCSAAGSYTVTPSSLDGYSFTPLNATLSVTGHETGVDFAGDRVDVQGRITTAAGAGVAGVNLTLDPGGHTALSGADGSYEFRNVSPGNYTVAPLLAGYTFQPLGRNIAVAVVDYTGADFTATGGAPTWAIRGTVALSSSVGVSGVTLVLSPGYRIATTDANGDYAFYGLGDGTYHLAPHFGFYTFTPVQSTVIIDGANMNAQDFTATPPPPQYTISGVLKDTNHNEGIPNAKVNVIHNGDELFYVYTDNSGIYSFNVPDGNYLVIPQKAYYVMSSPFINVVGAGQTLNLTGYLVNGATWDSFANEFTSNRCVTCHRPDSATAAAPNLRTYAEVKAAGVGCNNRVQGDTMPPSGGNLALYQKYFLEWKNNGFPEN
jgi:hypothetical protein